jgi:hypothetical protein
MKYKELNYNINTKGLLNVIGQHPYGSYGAIKEQIDNAIDAKSTDISIYYDPTTNLIEIVNKSCLFYTTQSVTDLCATHFGSNISRNDYGRLILLRFVVDNELEILSSSTHNNDYSHWILGMIPKEDEHTVKILNDNNHPFQYTTKVKAIFKPEYAIDINSLKEFIISVYNLHLIKEKFRIYVNGIPLVSVTPIGMPSTSTFNWGDKQNVKHKYQVWLWKQPKWNTLVYRTLDRFGTATGVGTGVFICSNDTLITYDRFIEIHDSDNSYFAIINDIDGYIAENENLNLSKLSLNSSRRVGSFQGYLRTNILPKDQISQNDQMTTFLDIAKQIIANSCNSGMSANTTNIKSHFTKIRKHKINAITRMSAKQKAKANTIPGIVYSPNTNVTEVPFIDVQNKVIHINNNDPLLEKALSNKDLAIQILSRTLEFLDRRKTDDTSDNSAISYARRNWINSDNNTRRLIIKTKTK